MAVNRVRDLAAAILDEHEAKLRQSAIKVDMVKQLGLERAQGYIKAAEERFRDRDVPLTPEEWRQKSFLWGAKST